MIDGRMKELQKSLEQLQEKISHEEDAFKYALEENHFEDVDDYQRAKRDKEGN